MDKLEIPTLNHHVGSTERVFAAHVNDLNDFYLHSELVRDSLGKLGQELYNEYSDSLTKPLEKDEVLHVGDYCACPSESEDWYRGLIRQIDSNGHASVFKLDYGDVQCIPIQFLRLLQERFFVLHRLAFHCSLVNLIRPADGWPLDVIEEFRSRLTTTFLFAQFVNYNEIRDISEVEITEKSSKISLNKDFEQYQIPRSILQINDKFVYKYIPMEKLDLMQAYQIRILYYVSPSHFYIYLKEKLNAHISFQSDLQQAVQNLRTISSPVKYQIVAAQDNHAIWHRAVITDLNTSLSRICLYFTDIGQHEYTSVHNIRPLPEEFHRKPAFAIPCRLHSVCPVDTDETSKWLSDDPVHAEINRLVHNNVTCKVCAGQDQIGYEIEIEIPKVGDLGAFLCDKKLVSRTKMNRFQRPNLGSNQSPQPSFARTQLTLGGARPSLQQQQQRYTQRMDPGNNSSNMASPLQQRSFNPDSGTVTVPQRSNIAGNSRSPLSTTSAPPANGWYTITQVHSAVEFYGLSQDREQDLKAFSRQLEDYYNYATNDPSLNVNPLSEGGLYVIQQDDKYHRVTIKNNDGGSRISVKLIDRGDEIIVDRSELLKTDREHAARPAFAQPFRLHGYDETRSSTNVTHSLKKLILNQRVLVEVKGASSNGFYPASVTLQNGQSVEQMLQPNEKNITSPGTNNKPSYGSSNYGHVESVVFTNTNRHHSTGGQNNSMGRPNTTQRADQTLPPLQQILAGTARPSAGRFGTENQTTSAPSSSAEQMSRFSNANTRNQQQPSASESKSGWSNDQPTRSNFGNNNNNNNPNMGSQSPFNRQQTGSSQFGNSQRSDENRGFSTNNQSRSGSSNYDNPSSSFEQKRSSGSNYVYDNHPDKPAGGNTFSQQNDSSTSRGGFAARGGGSGVSDRGGYNNYTSRNSGRNYEDNNNETSAPSFSGFSRGQRGFSARGDRNGTGRNQGDGFNDGNAPRSQNFGSSRGGRGEGDFQNRRFQEGSNRGGDFERRGNFSGRGGRGGRGGDFRGGRGGFGDRDNGGDSKSSMGANNTWSAMQPSGVNFEAGERFIENEIPKGTFDFVVSHVESANDFFIQLLSKGTDLSNSTDLLQKEYQQAPALNFNTLKENQVCLAKSSDDCWYRAVVLTTGLTEVTVRFVDFGDTAKVNSQAIRQLAKKHCTAAQYAYRCTLKNVQVIKGTSVDSIIQKCADAQHFSGKAESKTIDGKLLLESTDLRKMLVDIKAIKEKSEVTLPRIKCQVVHIENEQRRFYVQKDPTIVDQIAELVREEDENTTELSLEEVTQLAPDAVIIARFEDEPFRATVQSNASEDEVNVCFIDFGNSSSCPKTSLKRCSEKLSSYPHQSTECQLYGVTPKYIDEAYKYLEEHSDSETIEIAVVSEKDRSTNVLLYDNNQCINEKYGYDPSSSDVNNGANADTKEQPGTTAVREEEQVPLKTEQPVGEEEQAPPKGEQHVEKKEQASLNAEEVSSSNQATPDSAATATPEHEESETKETPSKYRLGMLTHIEQGRPYVYLQLIPESETIMDKINELIEGITTADQHKPSYGIGDHVIAQYSADENYYRARIESRSTTTNSNSVYFLDYGNLDEDVPAEHLFAYSEELEQIEPQAHGYLLQGITTDRWNNVVRPLVEAQLNETVEFYVADEKASTICMKLDIQETVPAIEVGSTITANVSAMDNDCFYIHVVPDGNLRVAEMDEHLLSCAKEHQDQCAANDLCVVSDEGKKYYRGRILSVDEQKSRVKCIDYGNTLENVSAEHLYVLPHDELYQQAPLAHQCRLHGVDRADQAKAMDDVIKSVQSTEQVTITVEGKDDDQCLWVTLTRENNDMVNTPNFCDTSKDNEDGDTKKESDTVEKDEQALSVPAEAAPAIELQSANNDEQPTSEMSASATENTSDQVDVTENHPPASTSTDPGADSNESNATPTAATGETGEGHPTTVSD